MSNRSVRILLAGLLCRAVVLLILALPATAATAAADPPGDPAEFFNGKVHPILATTCFDCHGSKKQKGKLRLDSAAALKKGGENGVVVVPGMPEKSVLITAINYADPDLEMPPKKKLSAEQIVILTTWVKMGAPWFDGGGDGKGVAAAAGGKTEASGDKDKDVAEETVGKSKPPLVGRLHPLIVHFPIACLLLALLAEALFWLQGSRWSGAVGLLVVIGFAGAIAAVVSGLYFVDEPLSAQEIDHRFYGWCTLVASALATVALVVRSYQPAWRWTVPVILVVAAVLVSKTGHIGGQMVYGMHFLW